MCIRRCPKLILILLFLSLQEIVTIFASVVGAYAISAVTIVQQLLCIAFVFPAGLGIAASTLVGNALGRKDCAAAQQNGLLSIQFMGGLTLVICPTIWYGASSFYLLYSSNEEVLRVLLSLTGWLAMSAFLDAMQYVGGGILRGAGQQHIGAVLNLIAFYVVGIPTSYILCFWAHMGTKGLIMGLVAGSAVQAVVVLYIVIFRAKYVYTELESVKNIIVGDELPVVSPVLSVMK